MLTGRPPRSGDHTVKVLCARTGHTLQVMHGHMRTPWVVRWHPTSERVLASGSLDHHVRLWDADTGDCIAHHDFGAPGRRPRRGFGAVGLPVYRTWVLRFKVPARLDPWPGAMGRPGLRWLTCAVCPACRQAHRVPRVP